MNMNTIIVLYVYCIICNVFYFANFNEEGENNNE